MGGGGMMGAGFGGVGVREEPDEPGVADAGPAGFGEGEAACV